MLTLAERLRSWAQNEEMIDQYFTAHGRDCNEAADLLESLPQPGVFPTGGEWRRAVIAGTDKLPVSATPMRSPAPSDTPRWIHVSERLPEHNDVVIVAGGVALWRDPSPEWPDGQFFSLTGIAWPGRPIQWDVTHWMPLPSLPSAERYGDYPGPR